METTYSYDDIFGTLLHKNEDDTERTYFTVECEYYSFYRWMFQHGWNLYKKKECKRKGLRGLEITLQRKIGD